MIKKFLIRNYKCFPELGISFKRMNILAGANAAGKSSVIQALLLAYAASNMKKGDLVDINEILGIQTGNPRTLIAQNPITLSRGDFGFDIIEDETAVSIRYSLDPQFPLNLNASRNRGELSSKICYLNAERRGPRVSYPAGGNLSIMPDGANAAYLVERADLMNWQVPLAARAIASVGKFSTQVEEWMNLILGDVQLSITTDLVKASTDVRYRNALVDYEVLPTMTGFGISYIFSVVTAALWCSVNKNMILIVENPEAHLHPAAQSRVGKFLDIIASSGVQVIVETHSEHLIDGARLQAAYLKKTEDMQVLFFQTEDRGIKMKEIEVNLNGELSEWPKGFFDQKSQDLRDLLSIRRTNAGRK
ncbi:DUF3696 domain-containing protein [Blautia sp. Sow4_E7]|uniref:DUF3696 domain-containing protein n=1 Tax=Blautia sp. Sow4_E7 TaxID=3438749 RepID=UPI003F90B711